MARRIIWTVKAAFIFQEILTYYFIRNGSKSYSKKLNNEIKSRIDLLIKFPYLGSKTEIKDVRCFVNSHYKIIYRIEKNHLVILMVWDVRQNPKDFKI